MKYLIISLMFLTACGTPELLSGANGEKGKTGTNGHGLVTLPRTVKSTECPNGGSALDVFVDADDSMNYSEGDLFLDGLVSCNGSNGTNSTASVIGYDFTSTSSCLVLVDGNLSGKKNGSNVRLYKNSTCSGSIESTLNPNDFYYYNSKTVLMRDDVSLVVRKVSFN